jgi:hypothetical protein
VQDARPYGQAVGKLARIRPVLRRYVPAELTGTAAACAGAWLAYRMNGSAYVAGLSGSLCEAAGYYAAILWNEARRQPAPASARTVLRSLPALIVEFGPAELVDTVLVRPLLMAGGPLLTGDPIGGTLAGKAAADVLFYAVVLPSSRLRRRIFPTPDLDP